VSDVTKDVRIQFRISPEWGDRLREWAEELGMSLSSFCSLAVIIGAKSLMRQASPEKFVDEEWIEKMRKAGFGMPEDSRGGEW
jgi:uncharacterized protein (DUF1778 family)